VLQGATAWHLLRTSAKLAPGETVVVHAAAGGVGTLACSWPRLGRRQGDRRGLVGGQACARARRRRRDRLERDGMASRELPEPVDVVALNYHSTSVIGFWLAHVFRRPEMFTRAMEELLDMSAAGDLRTVAGGTYPLADAPARTRTCARAARSASWCSSPGSREG
jgi:NADPH:quinone reductase